MNSPTTALRRQFPLPEEDQEMLDQNGRPWETIASGQRWLILHNVPVPAGYNMSQVSLAISIDPSYPQAALDMVCVSPSLTLQSGRTISNLMTMDVGGQQWQCWSRHYPWRPNIDCLETHLGRIEHWFEKELQR